MQSLLHHGLNHTTLLLHVLDGGRVLSSQVQNGVHQVTEIHTHPMLVEILVYHFCSVCHRHHVHTNIAQESVHLFLSQQLLEVAE
eukprot:Skav215962  [mRNA]  locus=scaffold226:1115701:1119843:- [translate_table: standard]